MKLRSRTLTIFVILVSTFGSAPSIQAQDLELIKFNCFPSTCKDTDFGFTSFSSMRVFGTCGDRFNPASDFVIDLEVNVFAVNCSFLVETETEGSGKNQTLLDDCGVPYQLGQISILGQIFNGFTGSRLYLTATTRDCAGGQTIPPPKFSGC
jgi:hypothetical protein